MADCSGEFWISPVFYIYDINSIRKEECYFSKKFFAVGTVLVVVSLLMELCFCGAVSAQNRKDDRFWNRSRRLLCTLFIYPFFLPFPLKKPIVKKINCVLHIQKVVYGVPSSGVLWFAGAYFCMGGMLGGWKQESIFDL